MSRTSRTRRTRRALVLAVALAAGAATATLGFAVSHARQPVVVGGSREVEIVIRHSRFEPDRLVVRQGATVRFAIDNRDPIAHEFILGDDEVHRRHASGTEQRHPPVPGEVSIGGLERKATIFTFDRAGSFRFACHLPGHLAYGMDGEVVVVP